MREHALATDKFTVKCFYVSKFSYSLTKSSYNNDLDTIRISMKLIKSY